MLVEEDMLEGVDGSRICWMDSNVMLLAGVAVGLL
jgi:hypothetical protein